MSPPETTIRSIERNLRHMQDYAGWRVGATSHPGRLRAAHGDPPFWRTWMTEGTDEAVAVVRHFVERGMQPDPRQGAPGPCVYMF